LHQRIQDSDLKQPTSMIIWPSSQLMSLPVCPECTQVRVDITNHLMV
jgi:hypothetical protein